MSHLQVKIKKIIVLIKIRRRHTSQKHSLENDVIKWKFLFFMVAAASILGSATAFFWTGRAIRLASSWQLLARASSSVQAEKTFARVPSGTLQSQVHFRILFCSELGRHATCWCSASHLTPFHYSRTFFSFPSAEQIPQSFFIFAVVAANHCNVIILPKSCYNFSM